jgi:hypothetical protein
VEKQKEKGGKEGNKGGKDRRWGKGGGPKGDPAKKKEESVGKS